MKMFYKEGAAHRGVYLPDTATEQHHIFPVQGAGKKIKASGFKNLASEIRRANVGFAALHDCAEHFYFRFHGPDYSNHRFRVVKIRRLCNG
jgi:hypothetical protein